jgi:cation transport ATPase
MADLTKFGELAAKAAKQLGIPVQTELAGKIGEAAGFSALAPLGNWGANYYVDNYMADASEEKKQAITTGISLAAAYPLLRYMLVPDIIDQAKEREWADLAMTSLSTGIAGTGIALNNKDFIQSAGMLGFLFSLAGIIEESIEDNTKKGIEALEKLIPETVKVRIYGGQGGGYELIDKPVADLKVGEKIWLNAGETIPTDSKILGAEGQARTAMVRLTEAVTGETHSPVKAIPIGETVQQGLIAEKPMLIETLAHPTESSISRTIELLENAAEKGKGGARIQQIVNKGYVPLMMAAVAAQLGYGYVLDRQKHDTKLAEKKVELGKLIADENISNQALADAQKAYDDYEDDHDSGHSFQHALKRATELAIKMAPCAIMAGLLVIPFTKYRLASKFNVKVRHNAVLEDLKNTQTVLSDVRGTLTTGQPLVKHIITHGGSDTKEMLSLLARAEGQSNHPVAKTIRQYAEKEGVAFSLKDSDKIQELNGGIIAHLDGKEVRVGGQHFFEAGEIPADLLEKANGFEDAVFAKTGKKWALVGMEDPLREGAKEALHAMRKQGKKVVLMTGMNEASAQKIMARLNEGMPEIKDNPLTVHSELKNIVAGEATPGNIGKNHILDQYYNKNGTIALVDGANDVSVAALIRERGGHALAIASTAADATKHAASMVIDGVHQIPELITLSQRMDMMMKTNFAAAGAWMAGLVGHHFFAQEEKQPSTVMSSILHEAPTVALTLASLYQSGRLAQGLPGPATLRLMTNSAATAQRLI